MVSVSVEREDVYEYWASEVQRRATVRVWNWCDGTFADTFEMLGQLVKKAPGYVVRENITPLELSPDGRYLFVRYVESDPKDATRATYGTLSQGIFAIDLIAKRAHLLAAFTNIGEVAWRTR